MSVCRHCGDLVDGGSEAMTWIIKWTSEKSDPRWLAEPYLQDWIGHEERNEPLKWSASQKKALRFASVAEARAVFDLWPGAWDGVAKIVRLKPKARKR